MAFYCLHYVTQMTTGHIYTKDRIDIRDRHNLLLRPRLIYANRSDQVIKALFQRSILKPQKLHGVESENGIGADMPIFVNKWYASMCTNRLGKKAYALFTIDTMGIDLVSFSEEHSYLRGEYFGSQDDPFPHVQNHIEELVRTKKPSDELIASAKALMSQDMSIAPLVSNIIKNMRGELIKVDG